MAGYENCFILVRILLYTSCNQSSQLLLLDQVQHYMSRSWGSDISPCNVDCLHTFANTPGILLLKVLVSEGFRNARKIPYLNANLVWCMHAHDENSDAYVAPGAWSDILMNALLYCPNVTRPHKCACRSAILYSKVLHALRVWLPQSCSPTCFCKP